jgi:ketosteroid isomerase-like protein
MSRENLEVVRRAYEVFDDDLESLLLLLDPAIEWVSPSDSIEPGIRLGHDGVREAFGATAMAWEGPMHAAEEFVDSDDQVLVTVTFRGHGRGSRMQAERTEFHVWTVRSGAVTRFEWFYQRGDALLAAGLGEP